MDERSREARAARRRAEWIGGVAQSFAEAEEADLEFWLAATPGERVRGVTLLLEELLLPKGANEPAPRLQRASGGVRERGR